MAKSFDLHKTIKVSVINHGTQFARFQDEIIVSADHSSFEWLRRGGMSNTRVEGDKLPSGLDKSRAGVGGAAVLRQMRSSRFIYPYLGTVGGGEGKFGFHNPIIGRLKSPVKFHSAPQAPAGNCERKQHTK
ncbi:hypothetical protein QTP88_012920 [Uroleucon formosanum]